MIYKIVTNSVFLLALNFYGCKIQDLETITPVRLKCEYASEPLGVDTPNPRFSWNMEGSGYNKKQTAYRILVYRVNTDDENVVWDSGKIYSSNHINIPFKGPNPLKSLSTYQWKIKLWDEYAHESKWSETATFRTGFIYPDTIKGQWIKNKNMRIRSPLLRKSFNIRKTIRSAHIYITSIGLNEPYLNGKKVGNRFFQPSATQFTERVLYSIYDVTNLLKQGENVLGIWLGEGQAALSKPDATRFTNVNMQEGIFPCPMALLQLHIKYADNTDENIVTDKSWKTIASPITYNNYYGGEDYDARLEKNGWCVPAYNDSDWQNVSLGEYRGEISSEIVPPVSENNIYLPVKEINRGEGMFEYDFGRTIGGYWEMEVSGEPGSTVTIRGSEKCGGNIYQKSLSEENTIYWDDQHTGQYYYRDCYSKYTLKGKGIEKYKPRFFFHGFRYVQVKLSSPGQVKIHSLKIIETNHNLVKPGSFECSDSTLNLIHDITVQTFKNNFIQGLPLSNPNSEKYGWTGDVHLFAKASHHSFDTPLLWSKWLTDFRDAQKWCNNNGMLPLTVPELRKLMPATDMSWLYAYPFLVWDLYANHKDTLIIKKNYKNLCDWYQFMLNSSNNYILDGKIGDHMLPGNNYRNAPSTKPLLKLINTAYLYKTGKLLEDMAYVIREKDDRHFFKETAFKIKTQFNDTFFNTGNNTYSEGQPPEGFTYKITANAIPLQMGLVPEGLEKIVLNYLINTLDSLNYRCFAGILGTKALIDVLEKYKRPDILYKVVKNPSYPGWVHMLNLGASTLNQTWDGSGDYNHCMFGSINQFFYNDLAGINYKLNENGNFICIAPYVPDSMNFVKCTIETPLGIAKSNWEKTSKGILFTIQIPHNSRGKFTYQAFSDDYSIYLNEKCIVKNNRILSTSSDNLSFKIDTHSKVLQLGSGNYTVEINFKRN